MSFTPTSDYRFERTVSVPRPSPTEKDKIIRDKFTAVFVAISPEELEAFDEELAQANTMPDIIKVQKDLAERVTVGWSDVVDANSQAIDFSIEQLRLYFRSPTFRSALISNYQAAMRGEEARLGN